MENNKIVASILLAGLIAMLSGTFANILYGSGGHNDEEAKRGYSVEVTEGGAEAKEKEEINILALIATADAEAGKKVAKKCVACHSFEKGGANKVGPNLYGVLGHKKAAKSDFQYSKSFTELDGSWDYETLWTFINKPSKAVPGTKMAFAGIRKPEQLADLIAYLRSLSDNPAPLPKVEQKVEEAEEAVE